MVICSNASQKEAYRALIRSYDTLPSDSNLAKVVPTIKQAVTWVAMAWRNVTAECIQNCWRHCGITDSAAPPKQDRRLTKQQKRRASLTAVVARSDSDSDDFEHGLETETAHEGDMLVDVLAADRESYDSAINEMRKKLSKDHMLLFDPLSANELMSVHDELERVGIAQDLDDDEIVELVMSHNAVGAGACEEVEKDPDEVFLAQPKLNLTQAEDMLNVLCSYFELVPDGLSARISLMAADTLSSIVPYVSEQKQKNMRQTSLDSFFSRKDVPSDE